MDRADADDTTDTEAALYRLATINRGLAAVAHLIDDFDLDRRVEVGPHDLAAVIHVFGIALDSTCSNLRQKSPRSQGVSG